MTEQQAQDAHVSADAGTAQNAGADADAPSHGQSAAPTGFDALPKETQDEIKALRRENAKYRTAAKDREDAGKSELEKLTGERDDYKNRYEALDAKYRESRAESVFTNAATKANARSPRTLFRAIKSDLEFDDQGAATNIDALIEALQKDEPDLFRTVEGDGGKGRSSMASGNDLNGLMRKYRNERTEK